MIRHRVALAALLLIAAPALAQTGTSSTTQPSTGATAETQAQPATTDTGSAAAAPGQGGVDPAVLKEIRDTILAAEKAAAKPPAVKTEEQKQAEAAAIARHRDAFMARVEERLAEKLGS